MRLIAAILLLAIPLHAADVTLAWDASVSQGIAGYKIYVGTASRVYQAPIVIANQLTYTVTGLATGSTYYFAATAFDADGNESDFSNEVFQLISGSVLPVTLQIAVIPTPGPQITWQAVTSIGMYSATISWQTDQSCSGILLWGADPSRLTAKVSNNQGTTAHLVNLTGLTPKTAYVYRLESVCGGVDIQSPVYSFNTKVQ